MAELRVGLVGAGHIAAAHLVGWRRAAGVRVVAIHDLHRDAAAARAREFGVERIVDGLDELMDSVDVVDVCTPPAGHFDIAARVIDAGRHLLIEKPIVIRVDEWDELRRRLEGSPSRIAVVHNVKFTRAYRRIRSWLSRGAIGRLLRVERHFMTHPTSDRMLAPGGHWSHALPGGRWFETLPHDLYLVYDLAGPLAIDSVLARPAEGEGRSVAAGEVAIHLEGASVFASIHYSANCRLNRRTVKLFGTHGVITADLLGDAAVLSRRRDRPMARAGGGVFLDAAGALARWVPDRIGYLEAQVRRRTPHSRLIEAFARHLVDGGEPPSPLEEIDYVVRHADAIARRIDRSVRPQAEAS